LSQTPPNQPPQGQFPQYPQQRMQIPQGGSVVTPGNPPPKKRRRRWLLPTVIAVVVIFGCVLFSTGFHNVGNATPAATATLQPTDTPAPTDTPTPQVQYPPKTSFDLHGLAGKGNADAIHEFHSESVGAVGACPQPKRLITVDASVTGQQLAQDLLAYFYAQQMDTPCGSVVFGYHTQNEANDPNGGGYTAARVLLNVTDASGADNLDPNASNLKHTLTLDTGGFDANQESVVTY